MTFLLIEENRALQMKTLLAFETMLGLFLAPFS